MPLDLSPAALARYVSAPDVALIEPAQAQAGKPPRKGLHPAWWGGILGANAADTWSTIRLDNDRFEEANPLWCDLPEEHPSMFALAKMGAAVGSSAAIHQLHKSRPTLAKVLAAAATAVPSIAALHNWRNSRKP